MITDGRDFGTLIYAATNHHATGLCSHVVFAFVQMMPEGLVKISSSECHANPSRTPFAIRPLTLISCFRVLCSDLYESILPRKLLAIPHPTLLLYSQGG